MDFSKMLHRFTVVPSLPKELAALQRIAYNLWWTWEPAAIELFKRLDLDLWLKSRHNPVEMLGILQQTTLDSLKTDEGFMSHLAQVDEKLQEYLSAKTWYEKTCNEGSPMRVAYFSMEFGLHESLPVYSGGLGILAGDHLKSASDLGIPLVGVGLRRLIVDEAGRDPALAHLVRQARANRPRVHPAVRQDRVGKRVDLEDCLVEDFPRRVVPVRLDPIDVGDPNEVVLRATARHESRQGGRALFVGARGQGTNRIVERRRRRRAGRRLRARREGGRRPRSGS